MATVRARIPDAIRSSLALGSVGEERKLPSVVPQASEITPCLASWLPWAPRQKGRGEPDAAVGQMVHQNSEPSCPGWGRHPSGAQCKGPFLEHGRRAGSKGCGLCKALGPPGVWRGLYNSQGLLEGWQPFSTASSSPSGEPHYGQRIGKVYVCVFVYIMARGLGRGVCVCDGKGCVCVYVCLFFYIRIQTVHLILLSTSTLGAPDMETSCRADHSRPPWRRTPAGCSLAETPLLWMLACVGTGSRTESEGAFVRGTGKSTDTASITVAAWTTSSFLAPPHTGMNRLYGLTIFLAPSSRNKNSASPWEALPPCTPVQSLHTPRIATVLTQ